MILNRKFGWAGGLLACTVLSGSGFASDWIPVTEKEGVVVQKKEIEGSPLLAFKGEGMVDAPLSKVASVIFDTKRAPEWMEDLVESRIIRWIGSSEFLEYDHIGTPFVLKDRDFLSRVKMAVDREKKQLRFEYHSVEDESVPETKYVRGDLKNTTFVLTSVENDTRTHVQGEIHCDPRGSVPKWIVNMFQKDWPIVTVSNLRKQLKKPDVQVDPKIVELLAQGRPARH